MAPPITKCSSLSRARRAGRARTRTQRGSDDVSGHSDRSRLRDPRGAPRGHGFVTPQPAGNIARRGRMLHATLRRDRERRTHPFPPFIFEEMCRMGGIAFRAGAVRARRERCCPGAPNAWALRQRNRRG